MATQSLSDAPLSELVGQLLIFGWQGSSVSASQSYNDHARSLIEDLAVGGIIFMGRNVGTPDTVRKLNAQFQAENAVRNRPPLFVSTDQEGGRVNRLNPPHFTRQPANKTLGDGADPEAARVAAAKTAGELRAVGFNLDYAPVLDVNNNPNNPVIGDRSYGDSPELVSRMGVAAINGFQDDGGILACGKHFPGHGDTDVDSHHALPVVPHAMERMHKVELLPFRKAIEAGVGAILTAHIVFTELDSDLPATLSNRILTGLLRQEMGFDGLIITDCLEMKGVALDPGTPEAAVRAVEAGADILLCCHTLSTQIALRDAVVAAVESGRITRQRIEESVARIVSAKERWVHVG